MVFELEKAARRFTYWREIAVDQSHVRPPAKNRAERVDNLHEPGEAR